MPNQPRPETITSSYVELGEGAYYVAGSRVSLASVIEACRQGASPETILQEFPYIGSLATVYGALTFILENPGVVDEYLADQEQRWEQIENVFPLPDDMVRRFQNGREAGKRLRA